MKSRENTKSKEQTAEYEYTSFSPDRLVTEYYKYGSWQEVSQHQDMSVGYLRDQLTGRINNSMSGFLRVCLVAFLALVQFVIIIFAPFLLNEVTVYFYVLLEVASILVLLVLINDKGSPAYRLAWISIVLLLPITGHIMYYLWGTTRGRKKLDGYILHQVAYGNNYLECDEEKVRKFAAKYPVAGRMSRYLLSEHFPLFEGNEVEYYAMGEQAFEAIFAEMEKAEKFILIEFFIVAEGALWDKMHEILLRKIKQGVEVKFLYDDFGAAIRTSKDFRKRLEEEGFEIRVFNPIHKYVAKLYMNYRTHQKIVVIDGKVGFTGGFNIADEYANLIERFGVWKDTGVKVKGSAVWGLTVVFLQMWHITSRSAEEQIDYERYRVSFDQADDGEAGEEPATEEKKQEKELSDCHVLSDGPANNPNNPIENIYNLMIQYAGKYLYVMTPYLIIEDATRDALIIAAKRGVDVRIITPAIPDKFNVNLLTKYNYGELLKYGVKIYEYTPGFIHAKGIMNEEAAIVGTINMDFRSFYLHYENGIWIHGGKAMGQIRADFTDTFAKSREVTYEDWKKRPLLMKLIQPIWNLFATLM